MNKRLRRAFIAGNWKMNLLASDVPVYASELKPLLPQNPADTEVVICAPFTSITAAVNSFTFGVDVGAQNVSQNEQGAYTGEVCCDQLIDLGVKYVIIGHSERRAMYGDTDDIVNKKVLAALHKGLKPIICVGETLEQRETGVTNDFVSMQVKLALYGVTAESLRGVVIAYEPIWAIGTGRTATPEDAQAVCGGIRAVLGGMYGKAAADTVPVLYGGSMNEKNARELLAQPDIDGGLIGGASLKPASFAAIVNEAARGN